MPAMAVAGRFPDEHRWEGEIRPGCVQQGDARRVVDDGDLDNYTV